MSAEVLFGGVSAIVAALGLAWGVYTWRKDRGARAATSVGRFNTESALTFDALAAHVSAGLDRLESDGYERVRRYAEQDELGRLADGLYSAMLFLSRALVTGSVDVRIFGNLMTWDKERRRLRVRYFAGPYSPEVIMREFPLESDRAGLAGKAFTTGEEQVSNDLSDALMEEGENWLAATMQVPLRSIDDCPDDGIAILAVDSASPDVFPDNLRQSEIRHRLDTTKRLFASIEQTLTSVSTLDRSR